YDVRAFIGAIVNVPEFMEEEQEEVRGMCRAIDEMKEKARMEGMERGIECGMERGMERGEERKLISLIRRKSQKGLDLEQISEFLELEESYVEKVIEFLEEHVDASDLEIVEFMQEAVLSQ
ncbi:MAG: hypothetical protein R3Y54_11490, partial [Eubacteriales bacterium]